MGRAGIIPARAGFTDDASLTGGRLSDHPRSRGVYVSCPAGESHPRGSSPLARGLHDSAMRRAAAIRIIPARAGFTCSMTRVTCIIADHPRSRGVYALEEDLALCDLGSSPLARGLHGLTYLEVLERRIIPARAGFTTLQWWIKHSCADHPRSRGVYCSLSQSWWRFPDHPRSRGVYLVRITTERPVSGSSPLARGLLFAQSVLVAFSGSSPLARGLLGPHNDGATCFRIIPARAGFTTP